MQEIATKVDPLLPMKKMPKSESNYYVMPKIKFKKNGDISAHMEKFLDKIGATLSADQQEVLFDGKSFSIKTEDPLKEDVKATIEDIDVVKSYLLSLGWKPTEIKERDITKNTDKTIKKYPEIVAAIDRYVKQTESSLF